MTRSIKMLCIALLTIAGFAGSSIPVRADDDRHEQCEKRIHQAEDKLRDAIHRHGEDSKQARKRREQLEQVKRNCGDNDRDHHDQH